MRSLNVPFNLAMLFLTNNELRNVKQVKALDIFDGGTTSHFHPEGLFSTEIFSRVGDERRSLLYGYIDIKAPIFHPLVFMALTKLKRLYGEIMSSRTWALWDNSLKDFVKAKPSDGARTGYAFFLEHWKDIVHVESKSNIRSEYIKLVEKNKEIALTRYVVVMPAGLRDMEVDELGRKSEDEINNLYRKFISLSNVIVESSLEVNPDIIDKPRYDMQLNFASLYDMIEAMIAGKKKLFLGKVASRRIFNGTRNVATSMNTSVSVLGGKGTPGFNSTIMGMYQYLQATLPVSTKQVIDFLQPYFPDVNSPANLTDVKTLQRRENFLPVRYYDKWATTEGVEKLIASFKEEELRRTPLLINGYYLGLIYLGPDGTFKVFSDIRELPAGRLPEHVRPLTLTDVMYLSVYKYASDYPVYVTRYPITGIGSIYPSMVHLRTTVNFDVRRELDANWAPGSEDNIGYEFPRDDSSYVNAMSPHTSAAAGLGLDYDGDTVSGNCAYSDEAKREAKHFFTLRKAYIGTNGYFKRSVAVANVNLILHNLTGDPIRPAMESASVMDMFRESVAEPVVPRVDTFTHNGTIYNTNDVHDMSYVIEPVPVSMALLEANIKDVSELDQTRLVKADTSEPLIGIREGGKIHILDGNHRLYKLSLEETTTHVPVKFIDKSILDIACMDDN